MVRGSDTSLPASVDHVPRPVSASFLPKRANMSSLLWVLFSNTNNYPAHYIFRCAIPGCPRRAQWASVLTLPSVHVSWFMASDSSWFEAGAESFVWKPNLNRKKRKKIRIEIENRRKKNKANNGIKKKMKKKSGGNTDNEKDFPHGEQFERMSKSTRIYPSRWRFGTSLSLEFLLRQKSYHG